jgi:hypothetical protein
MFRISGSKDKTVITRSSNVDGDSGSIPGQNNNGGGSSEVSFTAKVQRWRSTLDQHQNSSHQTADNHENIDDRVWVPMSRNQRTRKPINGNTAFLNNIMRCKSG